jgi:hypothetical protein
MEGRAAEGFVLGDGEPTLVELRIVGAFDAHCHVGVVPRPRHLGGEIRERESENRRESGYLWGGVVDDVGVITNPDIR